jgi:hypothetical protein
MSTKRSVGEKLVAPLLAAGTSVAASYVVKKGPRLFEETVLPRLREAAQGAGVAAEKLPDKARSAVSGGGELAEQLTEKARDVVGGSGGDGVSSRTLSGDELSQRRNERAQHRAQRRRKARR